MTLLKKRKIILTNDDGIQSPSIQSLIDEFKADYEITVVAPKLPQSAKGMSHAHGDVWVTVTEQIKEGIRWIAVDNSPTTCTSIALKSLKLQPDLIISGINYGENLGLNLFYSGTIGAAWEGAMAGIYSVATSLELPSGKHFIIDKNVNFSVAASVTKKIAEKILQEQPSTKLWSINTPTKATLETGIKECVIASKRWNYPIIKEEKISNQNRQVRFEFDPINDSYEIGSDIYYLKKGFITVAKIDSLKFPWTLL